METHAFGFRLRANVPESQIDFLSVSPKRFPISGHVCKPETLRAAYEMAKQNDGAPGTDGVTFEVIEAEGVELFFDQLREELVQRCYRPPTAAEGGDTERGGKIRQLSIPSIRDRVVQGALKLILKPIFEAARVIRALPLRSTRKARCSSFRRRTLS